MKRPQRVIWRTLVATSGGLLALSLLGCGSNKPCIDKSKPELEQCRTDIDSKQKEINQLKLQLAQALANPGTIKVDPSVLTIDGKNLMPKLREGNLSQEQVVATMRTNKAILKACYERAMKKNTNLRRQKITLTVAFKVQPSGVPNNISVIPNYDGRMIDCMKKAIKRWRFPQFSGQSVGVESPLTLTPKHN